MKKLLFAILISTVSLTSFAAPEGPLKVDVGASQLKWTGYHLAKSYEHWGYVNLKSGSIETDGSKITSGQFVIDMTTIVDKDLEKEKDNAKLVKHLKSDDFFGVEKFPEAKIVIKKTELKSGNTYQTTADITIRGITKEINFDTVINSVGKDGIEATADIKIKRTDFEVMYGWSVENAMLDGEFRIQVKLVAKS
jgi:polyisoprenoid-binding protein YceI